MNIRLADELADNGTCDLLETILREEEEHVDTIEAQIEQIKQMGLQSYLGGQIG